MNSLIDLHSKGGSIVENSTVESLLPSATRGTPVVIWSTRKNKSFRSIVESPPPISMRLEFLLVGKRSILRWLLDLADDGVSKN
jgi:hypothetical protein